MLAFFKIYSNYISWQGFKGALTAAGTKVLHLCVCFTKYFDFKKRIDKHFKVARIAILVPYSIYLFDWKIASVASEWSWNGICKVPGLCKLFLTNSTFIGHFHMSILIFLPFFDICWKLTIFSEKKLSSIPISTHLCI